MAFLNQRFISVDNVLRTAAVVAMWTLVASGATVFAFFFIMTITRWSYVDATELIAWKNGLVLDYKFVNATTGKAQPLLSSNTSFILIWQWCATLSMALGAAGLLWISSFPDPKMTTDKPTATKPRSLCATLYKVCRRARQLLRLQVPPRGLWRRLLGPSGLSVLDLLLVLLWAGLHAMWLSEMTRKALAARRMAPVLAARKAASPRPSVVPPNTTTTTAITPSAIVGNNTTHSVSASTASAQPAAPAIPGGLRRLLQQQTATSGPASAGAGADAVIGPSVKTAAARAAAAKSTAAANAAAANSTAAASATASAAKKTTVKPLPQAVQSSLAQWTGLVGNLDLLLLFFPLPRCNFLHWLLGSDFPSLLRYHRWLGHGTLLMYSLHGIMYLGLWARDGVLSQRLVWGMAGTTNTIAGLVSMCGGWLIWLTCVPVIRRRFFSLFFSSHLLGALTLLLFGFMHRKDVMPWVMPGALLYLLDVVLRSIQQAFNSTCAVVTTASTSVAAAAAAAEATAAADDSETLAAAASAIVSKNGSVLSLFIECDEALQWVGSDIVFLNVPCISWWQWHPFTLASSSSSSSKSPDDDSSSANHPGGPNRNRMVLHIKAYSHWTRRLLSRLASEPPGTPLRLHVSGPYPSANRTWLAGFDHHVIVAGGIGATPAFGILLELIARRKRAAAAEAAAATRASEVSKGSSSSCPSASVPADPTASTPPKALAPADTSTTPSPGSNVSRSSFSAPTTCHAYPATTPSPGSPVTPSSRASRATLIWMTRSEDELGTLPPELLEEASRTGDDAWLDLQIFLTAGGKGATSTATAAAASGAATENMLPTSAAPAPGAASVTINPVFSPQQAEVALCVSPHHSSVQPSQQQPGVQVASVAASAARRPLSHPYMFSPLLWATAVLLCFGGAFAGLIAVQSYDAHRARTVAVRDDLTHVGMLQFAALGLGAVLPPGVLMLAVHVAWAASRHRRAASTASSSSSTASCDLPSSITPPYQQSPSAIPLAVLLANARTSVTSTATATSCDTDDTAWREVAHPASATVCTAATAAGEKAKDGCNHNNNGHIGVVDGKKQGGMGKGGKAKRAAAVTVADVSPFITYGRPDLRALLDRLSTQQQQQVDTAVPSGTSSQQQPQQPQPQQQQPARADASAASAAATTVEDLHVAVMVAGPVSLVEAVEEVCASLNGVWGRRGRAYLQVKPLTHEF